MNTVKNYPILILGATGFVGSQLMERLIKSKKHVIALARTPEKIKRRSKYLRVIQGDVLDVQSYSNLLDKVESIYYLIHAMDTSGDFESLEAQQASQLSSLLKKSHRVIYLSGLGEANSAHIRSRHNVGQIFHHSKARSFELRASIIIGSGSLSFEMIYGIARRFPFTIRTDWSEAPCEPVALSDILYTLEKLGLSELALKPGIYEIGAGSVIPYSELMILCSEVMNKDLRQIFIPRIPKRLVLEVMRFMLPEYYQIGAHLMGSIEIPTSVEKENILNLLGRKPVSLTSAMKKAVAKSQKNLHADFNWKTKIDDLLATLPITLRLKLLYSYKALEALNKLRKKLSVIN